MQKIFPFVLLTLGLLNLYRFIETFIGEFSGPYHLLFWETGLTGYRVKCVAFAAVFIFLAWQNYRKTKN